MLTYNGSILQSVRAGDNVERITRMRLAYLAYCEGYDKAEIARDTGNTNTPAFDDTESMYAVYDAGYYDCLVAEFALNGFKWAMFGYPQLKYDEFRIRIINYSREFASE